MLQVCRICLRDCGSLIKITRNLLPKNRDASTMIMQFYEFLCEMLIKDDNEFFEKMCRKCLNTIRDMYSLLDKCEKSTNILIQMKDSSVEVRKLSDKFLDRINVKRPRPENEDIELDEIIPPKRIKDETNESDNVVDEDEFIEVAVMNDDASECSQDPTDKLSLSKKTIEESLTSVADDLADVIDFGDSNDSRTISADEPTKSAVNRDNSKDNQKESGAKENTASPENNETKKCNVCRKAVANDLYEKHIATHLEKPREFFRDVTNERKRCPKCPLSYKRISMLGDHMKVIHGISTAPGCDPIPCEICSKPFRSLELLVEHKNMHPESEQYQCRICSKEGIKMVDFAKHVKFHLDSESPNNYKCSQCSETFTDMATMMVHEKVIHTKRTHACEFCSNKYTTRIGLQNHIMTKHGSNKLVSCQICGLHLTRKEELAGHMEGFKEKLKCEECPLKFSNLKDVEAHKLFHRGGKNACSDCQLAFHATFILQRHMEMHSMLPFQCQYCKRYLRTEASHKHHVAQHQENDAEKGNSKDVPNNKSSATNTTQIQETSTNATTSTAIQNKKTTTTTAPQIKVTSSNTKNNIASPSTTPKVSTPTSNAQTGKITASPNINSVIPKPPPQTAATQNAEISSPTTGTQNVKVYPSKKLPPGANKGSPRSRRIETPTNDTVHSGNNLVISDVRSVPHNVQENKSLENLPVTKVEESVGDTNVSVVQNLQNIDKLRNSVIVDDFIISEVKEETPEELNQNLILSNNVGMNPVAGSIILNNSGIQMPVTSNVVYTSNILSFQDNQTAGIYNSTNVATLVAQPTFLMCNVQGSAVPSGMLVLPPPPLTAVDYICNQRAPSLPIMASPNFSQSNSIFTTIPTSNINQNINENTNERHQIAKKSTTTLLAKPNTESSSTSKARISVRRDLMKASDKE